MTNTDVIRCWITGRPANTTGGGQLHTDGHRLFSYQLLIATRSDDGTVAVEVPYTSSTTARHISMAMRAATNAGLRVQRSRLRGETP